MISTKDMKELEDNCGIAKITLMENAGRGAYQYIKTNLIVSDKIIAHNDKKFLIVCSHGNNGGDGFVLARYLKNDAEVDVLFIGDEDRLKEEAKENYKSIENDNEVQLFENYEMIDFSDYDIIVDAILGTGIKGALNDKLKAIIERINDSGVYLISLDIPTGLNPDTGEVDIMINANLILTFHDAKDGLSNFMEKVEIIDISIL